MRVYRTSSSVLTFPYFLSALLFPVTHPLDNTERLIIYAALVAHPNHSACSAREHLLPDLLQDWRMPVEAHIIPTIARFSASLQVLCRVRTQASQLILKDSR